MAPTAKNKAANKASSKSQDAAPIMAALEKAVVQIDSLSADELLNIRGLFLQLFETALDGRGSERVALQTTLERHTKKALSAKLPGDPSERLKSLKKLSETYPTDELLSTLTKEVNAEIRAANKEKAKAQEGTAKSTMANVGSSKRKIAEKQGAKKPGAIAAKSKTSTSEPKDDDEEEDAIDSFEAERMAAEEGKTPYVILESILLERSAGLFRHFAIADDEISPAAKSEGLPFYLHPSFAARLQDYLKMHVIPQVLDHKFTDTRILSEVRKREDLSIRTQLEEQMYKNHKGKEALVYVWDFIWNEITESISGKANPKATDAQKKKRKSTRQAWKALVKALTFGDDNQPTTDDIAVIRAAIFWPPEDRITQLVKGVYDSITQENAGESSEGWVAKYLGDLCLKEADYFGDMVALWSYYVHCDALIEHRDSGGNILKSFLGSQGKSMHERRQRSGLILRFGHHAKEITKGWR